MELVGVCSVRAYLGYPGKLDSLLGQSGVNRTMDPCRAKTWDSGYREVLIKDIWTVVGLLKGIWNILLLYEPVTRVDSMSETSSQVVWSVSCGSTGDFYDVCCYQLKGVYLHPNPQASTKSKDNHHIPVALSGILYNLGYYMKSFHIYFRYLANIAHETHVETS